MTDAAGVSLPELARRDLGVFGALVFGLWPAAHHSCWAELLQSDAERLLLIAPPGHAKSTWCTVIYPAWLIGRRPEVNILLVSATAAQATLFSGAVRAAVSESAEYQQLFPTAKPDRKRGWALAAWYVARTDGSNKDATVAACGVGGPLIGRRADVIIVDDPCDDATTATAARRDKLWRWYRQTLLTRLRPGGRIIVVMTRWHPDDLAGRLIATGEYTTCHMPALSADGEVVAEITYPPPEGGG